MIGTQQRGKIESQKRENCSGFNPRGFSSDYRLHRDLGLPRLHNIEEILFTTVSFRCAISVTISDVRMHLCSRHHERQRDTTTLI